MPQTMANNSTLGRTLNEQPMELCKLMTAWGQNLPSRDARKLGCFALISGHIQMPISCSAECRYCCKSLFAPLIANFSGCRRGFRVNMWGTSPPGDKLTGDFDDEPDATLMRSWLGSSFDGKFVTRRFQTLQQNLPGAVIPANSIADESTVVSPGWGRAGERQPVLSRSLRQEFTNLRQKLTRAVRLRYKIIAARCTGFRFISA
jgi:hypothetical protein